MQLEHVDLRHIGPYALVIALQVPSRPSRLPVRASHLGCSSGVRGKGAPLGARSIEGVFPSCAVDRMAASASPSRFTNPLVSSLDLCIDRLNPLSFSKLEPNPPNQGFDPSNRQSPCCQGGPRGRRGVSKDKTVQVWDARARMV